MDAIRVMGAIVSRRAAEYAEGYRKVEPRLYPWQREHTKQLIRCLHWTRGALDVSGTGTGKSFA